MHSVPRAGLQEKDDLHCSSPPTPPLAMIPIISRGWESKSPVLPKFSMAACGGS